MNDAVNMGNEFEVLGLTGQLYDAVERESEAAGRVRLGLAYILDCIEGVNNAGVGEDYQANVNLPLITSEVAFALTTEQNNFHWVAQFRYNFIINTFYILGKNTSSLECTQIKQVLTEAITEFGSLA